MISQIQLTNYRNLDLSSGLSLNSLNIFVGANGSGKSNLVRVLRFLQDGLIGQPDARRGVTSYESAIAAFGSSRILDMSVEMPAVVGMRLCFRYSADSEDCLCLDLDVSAASTVTVRKEDFYRYSATNPNQEPEYYYRAHTPDVGRGVIGKVEDGKLALADVPQRLSSTAFAMAYLVNTTVTTDDEFVAFTRRMTLYGKYPLVLARGRLLTNLTGWSFYESSRMNVDAIRRTPPELAPSDIVLSPSADNLALVLHNLIRDHVDFEERLTEAMRELFPRTKRLRIIPVGRLTLQMEWYLNDQKQPFYLDEMSDGTVRMLCWAAVLLSPKPQSLIVIDEPEAGVHPAWLRILAGWIREASRHCQVIISTHSAELLDYFTEDYDKVRVFTKSDSSPNGYIVKSLEPNHVDPKLAEGWKLGDLYRVGDPSIGGWPW